MATESAKDRIIFGLAAFFIVGMLGWGGVNLVDIKASVAANNQRFTSIESSIVQMQSTLQDGTRSRYTSDMATVDRNSILSLISQNSEWNRKQDDALKELELWRARMDGAGKNP